MVPLAGDVGAERAERVAERRRPEHGEHVPALREPRGHLGRRAHELRRRAGDRAARLARRVRRGRRGAPAGRGRPAAGRAAAPSTSASRGVAGAAWATACAVTTPTTISVPAGKPGVLRDQPDAKARDGALGRARVVRGRARDAPSTSSVPQSASGTCTLPARRHGLPEHDEPGDRRACRRRRSRRQRRRRRRRGRRSTPATTSPPNAETASARTSPRPTTSVPGCAVAVAVEVPMRSTDPSAG